MCVCSIQQPRARPIPPRPPPERLPPSNGSRQLTKNKTLIYLGPAKNAPHKCISRKKADRAGEQAVDQTGQEAVAEEQQARNQADNVQPRRVVPDAVGEDPEGAGAADEEALPPPVVVLHTCVSRFGRWECETVSRKNSHEQSKAYLGAELDVRRDDGDLADRDYQDGTDDAQEAEDVVVAALVLPQALEHKHELDEQDGKGDEAGEESAGRATSVPRLRWDLSGTRVGLGRVAPRFCSDVAVPAARVDEGDLN